MNKISLHISRTTYFALAAALVIATVAPILISRQANAAQLVNRYIKMSSSTASATDVTYEVGFRVATTGTIQGIVVEFCSDSPLLGDTCSAPAGFDVNEAGLALTDTIAGGAFAIDAATDANTLILTRTDATSITAATDLTLTLGDSGGSDGITNQSATNTTFYARLATYVDDDDDSNGCSGVDDNATCYTSAAPNDTLDDGGVALSTATVISITARVMETLVFCVSKAAPGAACTATDAPVLVLGHGSPVRLDNTQVDTDTAHFQASTNASGGVKVRMKGSVLTSGSNTIVNTGAANTPVAIAAGTASFGMRIGTTTGAGNDRSAADITVDGNYDHATNYGYDTTSGENTTTTYGDEIATVAASQNTFARLTFAATAALNTPAGLYQSTQQLIATGTY